MQEALQNILKHASASKVKLELLLEKNNLFITIHDNGVGFNPIFKTQSAGLANMAARMKSIGGKFEINLAIDGLGTTCKFIIPLEKVEDI